jgi:hypothetical protein
VAAVITPEEAARQAERAASPQPNPNPNANAPSAKPIPFVPFSENEAADAEEKKPERDLGAELRTAVGDLASCVKPRTAAAGTPAGTTLSIALEAVVTETGLVTRSGARGTGHEPDELDCARKRLGAVRLVGPIEAAPRTITASVTLTLQPAQPVQPGGEAPAAPQAAPTGSGYP